MTGDQLKTWRTNRGLSQAGLAERLGWTRDQLANVETERTTMKENIEHKLAMVDESLARQPANAEQVARPAKGSTRRYLSLAGRRIKPEMVKALKKGDCYYEYGWQDSESGHHYFNLMQFGLDAFRKLQGLCTPISLNVNTWTVGAFVMANDPAVARTIPDLQARLDKNTDDKPDLSTVLMSNDDAFRPIGEIIPPKANFFQ